MVMSQSDRYSSMQQEPNKILFYSLIVFCVLAFFALCYVGYEIYKLSKIKYPVAPVGLNVIAKPAPEVITVPRVSKPIKSKIVKVYPESIKSEIKLPDVVQNDTKLDVIASHQVPADDHPQTITTLINTDTGESQTFVKRDPMPWLGLNYRGEAGIYVGVKNGEQTARLEVKQEVLQIKSLHIGVTSSIDQPINSAVDTSYFVGAGAWMRW